MSQVRKVAGSNAVMLLLAVAVLAEPAAKGKEIPLTSSSKEALECVLEGRKLVEELRLTDAIPYFQKAVQADPNNAAAYFNLGLLLRDTGNTTEANQMFQRAQQLDAKLVPPASPSPTTRPSPTR